MYHKTLLGDAIRSAVATGLITSQSVADDLKTGKLPEADPKRPVAAALETDLEIKKIRSALKVIWLMKNVQVGTVQDRVFNGLSEQVQSVISGDGQFSDIVGADSDSAIHLVSKRSVRLWNKALKYAKQGALEEELPNVLRSAPKEKAHDSDYKKIEELYRAIIKIKISPFWTQNIARTNQTTEDRFSESINIVRDAAEIFCNFLAKPGKVRPHSD